MCDKYEEWTSDSQVETTQLGSAIMQYNQVFTTFLKNQRGDRLVNLQYISDGVLRKLQQDQKRIVSEERFLHLATDYANLW